MSLKLSQEDWNLPKFRSAKFEWLKLNLVEIMVREKNSQWLVDAMNDVISYGQKY